MTQQALGRLRWIIPDGFLPPLREAESEDSPGYFSHESLCVLNANAQEARLTLTIYFEQRDPVVITDIPVGGRRSCHLRMERLRHNGQVAIGRGEPYSLLVESTLPVVVQLSRLDTTQSNMAFLSALGHPLDDPPAGQG
ncbi:MAG: hypothetical protein JW810_08715 [Sedimentisphaerales bacterium]|nr:hypothetical protein [Sedimentisphaerales bacterium]